MTSKFEYDPNKHVELPEAEAEGGGFVTKEAYQETERARSMAELAKKLKSIEINPMDILHEEAIKEDRKREERLEKEKAELEKKKKPILEKLKDPSSIFPGTEQAIAQFSGDREFMLAAIKNKPEAFRLADAALLSDRDFVSKAFELVAKQHHDRWPIFRFGDPSITRDRGFLLNAIRQSEGAVLEDIDDPKIRGDRELILEAVKFEYGRALKHADPKLQADKDVVREALKTSAGIVGGYPLKYASPELRSDRSFVLEAIEIGGGHALDAASDELKKDREVVSQAVRKTPEALRSADKTLRGDKKIVLEALVGSYTGSELRFADSALTDDPEFMAEVFEKCKDKYRFPETFVVNIGYELAKNKDFLLRLAKIDFRILRMFEWKRSNDFYKLNNDPDFIMRAMEINPKAIELASYELREQLDQIARENGFVGRVVKKINSLFRRGKK